MALHTRTACNEAVGEAWPFIQEPLAMRRWVRHGPPYKNRLSASLAKPGHRSTFACAYAPIHRVVRMRGLPFPPQPPQSKNLQAGTSSSHSASQVCTHIHVRTHACTRTHTHKHTHVRARTHTYACSRMHTHTHAHAHTHTRTHTHHTHTYTSTHARTSMCAASCVSDCRPLPPTPTSRAWPPGCFRMRAMRATCSSANLNSTSSKGFLLAAWVKGRAVHTHAHTGVKHVRARKGAGVARTERTVYASVHTKTHRCCACACHEKRRQAWRARHGVPEHSVPEHGVCPARCWAG